MVLHFTCHNNFPSAGVTAGLVVRAEGGKGTYTRVYGSVSVDILCVKIQIESEAVVQSAVVFSL